jgi:hypothetical protein
MNCVPESLASEWTCESLVERAEGWLREILAILDAIDVGELLVELPCDQNARRSHQLGMSLLVILRRELVGLSEELGGR